MEPHDHIWVKYVNFQLGCGPDGICHGTIKLNIKITPTYVLRVLKEVISRFGNATKDYKMYKILSSRPTYDVLQDVKHELLVVALECPRLEAMSRICNQYSDGDW